MKTLELSVTTEYRHYMANLRLRSNVPFSFDDAIKITVPWVCPGSDDADPNATYRPWLEQNVGVQSHDWDWQVGIPSNTIDLYILHNHVELASFVALRWACNSE